MGYITAALTPEERRRAGPKNGAQSTATSQSRSARRRDGAGRLDPAGPGPSHRAGASRRGRAWLKAARHSRRRRRGYRQRRLVDRVGQLFKPVRAGGRRRRATGGLELARSSCARRRQRCSTCRRRISPLPTAASPRVRIRTTRFHSRVSLRAGHWAPGTLPAELGQTIRETVFWTPPQLTAPTDVDQVNSSLCHGFIFDFCGVEIDRDVRRRAHRPLCHHARLRPHPASGDGDGPDQRRLCPGARCGAL